MIQLAIGLTTRIVGCSNRFGARALLMRGRSRTANSSARDQQIGAAAAGIWLADAKFGHPWPECRDPPLGTTATLTPPPGRCSRLKIQRCSHSVRTLTPIV